MKKNILITGGTGFIGKHLVSELCKKNEYNIYLITRYKNKNNSKININYIYADLINKNSLKNKLNNIDIVLHFAGVTKAFNKMDYYKGNFIATKNLIEELKHNEKKIRFILCSSQAAQGPSDSLRELNEYETKNPVSYYGLSKSLGEDFLLRNSSYFDSTIIRPTAVYGEGDTDVALVIKMISKGINFKFSHSSKYFNLIYVRDLVDICIKLINNINSYKKIYNVNDGLIYSYESFAYQIRKILNLNKNIYNFYIPYPLLLSIIITNELFARIIRKPTIKNLDKIKELKYDFWVASNQEILKEYPDYIFTSLARIFHKL